MKRLWLVLFVLLLPVTPAKANHSNLLQFDWFVESAGGGYRLHVYWHPINEVRRDQTGDVNGPGCFPTAVSSGARPRVFNIYLAKVGNTSAPIHTFSLNMTRRISNIDDGIDDRATFAAGGPWISPEIPRGTQLRMSLSLQFERTNSSGVASVLDVNCQVIIEQAQIVDNRPIVAERTAEFFALDLIGGAFAPLSARNFGSQFIFTLPRPNPANRGGGGYLFPYFGGVLYTWLQNGRNDPGDVAAPGTLAYSGYTVSASRGTDRFDPVLVDKIDGFTSIFSSLGSTTRDTVYVDLSPISPSSPLSIDGVSYFVHDTNAWGISFSGQLFTTIMSVGGQTILKPSLSLLPPTPTTQAAATYILSASHNAENIITHDLRAEISDLIPLVEYAFEWTASDPNININNPDSRHKQITTPAGDPLSSVQFFEVHADIPSASFNPPTAQAVAPMLPTGIAQLVTYTLTARPAATQVGIDGSETIGSVSESVVYQFHDYQSSDLQVAAVDLPPFASSAIRVSWTPPSFNENKFYRLTISDSDGNAVTGPTPATGTNISSFQFPIKHHTRGGASQVELYQEYTYTLQIGDAASDPTISTEQSMVVTLSPDLPFTYTNFQATYVASESLIQIQWDQPQLFTDRHYNLFGRNVDTGVNIPTAANRVYLEFLINSPPLPTGVSESEDGSRITYLIRLQGEDATKLYGQTYDWHLISGNPGIDLSSQIEGQFSTPAILLTVPPLPPQNVAINLNGDDLVLTWDASTGVASYDYQIQSASSVAGAGGLQERGSTILPPIFPDSP